MLRGLLRRMGIVSAIVCGAVVAGAISPAQARESVPSGSPVVGAFGLGDDLEGTISERDGAFEFELDAGSLPLRWDARDPHDRFGLGVGWSFGFGHVETVGGVRVARAAGGRYEPDPTHPSGLAGYGVHDARFESESGLLAPRAGGPAPVAYEFALYELGGVVTYFDGFGDPVAQVSATGQRSDWAWDGSEPHRLLGMTDPDGVRSTLDWASDPGQVVIRAAANLPAEPAVEGAEPVASAWRVELDDGRISRLVDPADGVMTVGYHPAGMVERVTAPCGASTVIAWHSSDDAVARVASVRTVDADGQELSARTWAVAGDGIPSSGWPAYDGDAAVFWSGDQGLRYVTALSDGSTRVESEYNSLHELIGRRMVASTASGDVTLREQRFAYPGTDQGGLPDPRALPGNWSRPVRSDLTFRDVAGRERVATESFEFDELGRVIDRTAIEGVRTVTAYDDVVPDGGRLPIGLPVEETATAPDGLTRRTVHTLSDARTAVVATETSEGRPGSPLTPTVREEFDVTADGFVSERRRFPVGEDAPPARTRWSRQVDLAAGTVTTTETVGVDAAGAATTTTVRSLRHGGQLAAVGPAGTETSTVFDALGRPVEQRDPSGNVTRIRHQTAQRDGRNATVVSTADRVERTEIHDPLGRVVQVTDNIRDGEAVPGHVRVAETREYPAPGVGTVTDAWGATTTAHQDVFGHVVRVVTPTGLVQVTEHDEVGHSVTTGLTPTGQLADAEQTRTDRFDDAGRVVASASTRGDGAPAPAIEHGRDGFGRVVAGSDGIVDTSTTHDERGRPTTVTVTPIPSASTGLDVDGRHGEPITAEQRFDGFGSRTEKTLTDREHARSGGVRTFDSLGRVVSEVDQAGRATTLEYTVDGLVSRIDHGNGHLTELTYDAVTRALIRGVRSAPDLPTVETEYRYDRVTGRLVEQVDPRDPEGTRIATEYDAFGNPTRVRHADGAVISYEYDEHGRGTVITDVAGNRTQYRFDAAGLITDVAQRSPKGDLLASVRYAYDAFGRVARLERGNGVRTAYTFTSAGEIATERTSHGETVHSEREYAYDVRGNLTRRTDAVGRHEGGIDRTTTTYQYDAFDRLIASSVRDGVDAAAPPTISTAYELSPSGDILRETAVHHGVGGAQTTVREFEYHPCGELSAITTTAPGGESTRVEQDYDDAGNLTLDVQGTTYGYDAANRPRTEHRADGSSRDTEYWPDGARRAVSDRGEDGAVLESTTYHWSGTMLLNDATTRRGGAASTGDEPSDAQTASYLIGAGRHSRTVTAGGQVVTSYLGTDRHGNVVDLTDHSGEVTTRYAYTDYGVRTIRPVHPDTAVDSNPFGFSGEYTNPDGRQHLAVRTYDPVSMRFTTMDTADLHNVYSYADLNPVTSVDPSGRSAEPDLIPILTLVGAVVGLALTLAGCVFSPPLGIMQGFTAAAMIGDVFAAANASVRLASPSGLPGSGGASLTQMETFFGVIATIGFVYGFGTFVSNVITRRGAIKAGMASARAGIASERGDRREAVRSAVDHATHERREARQVVAADQAMHVQIGPSARATFAESGRSAVDGLAASGERMPRTGSGALDRVRPTADAGGRFWTRFRTWSDGVVRGVDPKRTIPWMPAALATRMGRYAGGVYQAETERQRALEVAEAPARTDDSGATPNVSLPMDPMLTHAQRTSAIATDAAAGGTEPDPQDPRWWSALLR